MRRMMIVLALTLVADLAGAATTDADKFKQSVESKLAPPFGTIGTGKWKALCVCNASEHAGVIESFGGIPNLGVTCTVPTFDGQGNYTGGAACYDWTPLTK